ncbi:hypothetical protein C8A05DRAFT_17134 [Staphylotrichum tortipilum]|uniref:Uncharacterized protein n=1 Tax=Staphylotrichum tortipilum TaxID=2831512 RepID=A0AAN6MGQ7_9PEZI|nr:hypothetical protein C8A05DRAFT_17134 [Staphylotrichum longicolle]
MARETGPRAVAAASTSAHSFATHLRRAVAMLVSREDKNCNPQPGVDFCEKPSISSSAVTWIIVGVVLGVILVATCTVLFILHLRRKRRDRREDMDERFQMSDYGLDDVAGARKPRIDDDMKSQDGSPNPYGRRSRDPLQGGTEPRYQPSQSNGHLNPFDDASSFRTGNGTSSYAPSVNQQWPARDSSQKRTLA